MAFVLAQKTRELAQQALTNVMPVGGLVEFAGETPPSGYLVCDGSLVSRTEYADLFTAIGEVWGAGDGSTTFALPDLRGRVTRGRDNGAGRDPDAAGRTENSTGGNTGDAVGSVQGDATKRPNSNFTSGNNSVSHTHSGSSLSATTSGSNHRHGIEGHSGSIADWYGGSSAGFGIATGGNQGSDAFTAYDTHTHSISGSTGGVSSNHTHNITSGGDNETRPQNAYVNYIIKY